MFGKQKTCICCDLRLKSNVSLFFVECEKIDGTIVAPDGPDSWPSYSSKRQWLVFYRINGLSMKGAGVIDGKGEKWWNLSCKPHNHKVYFILLPY